ncbi:hypothetical protein GMLC_34210 [Geomonas limicola]|uniref:Lipoprotein n=1 Tax=Geomonas limicola TaxID=2740186 RepID=A0A6V8NB36_9BACT|nr:hypothetical protein [Geomonas limicola]GFO69842.1 hypothetical protein GMLC_34210 [Geomonas limicola]
MKRITTLALLLALLAQISGCIIWPGYYDDDGYYGHRHYYEHGRHGEWHDRRY